MCSGQVKARYPAEKDGAGCDLRPDFDLPEPPLEYCEARKPNEEVLFLFFPISDSTKSKLIIFWWVPSKCPQSAFQGKRGILSSIFGVVRSKEESGKKSVECLPFGR